jgi:hypothetical protein
MTKKYARLKISPLSPSLTERGGSDGPEVYNDNPDVDERESKPRRYSRRARKAKRDANYSEGLHRRSVEAIR